MNLSTDAPPATTQFNSSLASLERLHELLISCNYYSSLCYADRPNLEMLKQWNFNISALFREISPKLTDGETAKINAEFQKLKSYGKIILSFKKLDDAGHVENIDKINTTVFRNRFEQLGQIEILLRKFADDHGMLLTNKDDSRFILGR